MHNFLMARKTPHRFLLRQYVPVTSTEVAKAMGWSHRTRALRALKALERVGQAVTVGTNKHGALLWVGM